MANTLKKKTPPPPDPGKLKPEKEEQVTVKEVVKDERTTKIAGAISLLIAAFLFVSFTSYFFTWQSDQDKVFQFSDIFKSDVHVSNLMGVLGAYFAHLFIFKGFGIAAYLFCTIFFVLGVNLLFSRKIFSLARNLKYVIVGLLVLSVSAAYVTGATFFATPSSFSWGGGVGELMTDWLIKWIGSVGTGALLAVAVLSYIIWRFNPTFKLPQRSPRIKPVQSAAPAPQQEEEQEHGFIDTGNVMDAEPAFIRGTTLNELYANDALTNNNKLKNDGKGVVVILPKQEESNQFDFDLSEKEPEGFEDLTRDEIEDMDDMPLDIEENDIIEPVKKEPPVKKPELKIQFDDEVDMELEIQERFEDEEEIPVPVKRGQPDKLYDPMLELSNYKFPSLDLLETHGSEKIVQDTNELEANKNQIIATLKNYDIAIQRIAATVGPTVTLYEIVPAPGVRISRIKNLEDDIALSLAALGIRIIAPIPGKGTIGIEVPNVRKSVVGMKTLLASEKFQNNQFSLPIAIGKKIDNENFIVDLAAMPHLLMAGATGQGKSVGINTLLVSLLYKKHPSQLKFVLVDPKKVELSLYRVIEKHFLAKLPGEEEPIITDTKKVVHTLNALCTLMDIRYDLLKEAACRNIKEYNEKFIKRKLNPQKGHEYLPFIVLVIDEFADLIMTAGKEIELPIARLAQLARAVGIHLIIATQRPSVNIITGTIKANFPARVAFKVSSKIDSRTILDAGGAEQLIGKGDMLISYNGEITRLQCAFVDTPEVENVCTFIEDQQGYPEAFKLPEYVDEKEMEGKEFDLADKDPLFEDAARLIVQNQMGSTSLIQRRMKLGYNRAGRLMDQLEIAGIVGPNLGSKAREVMCKTEAELQEILNTM
ncbi:MAG TPA: DNA translocase FtsK [Chitinophagaceae bacterium]|nr:DNA translocase FtsK [Chitinophagaceae bacterium]